MEPVSWSVVTQAAEWLGRAVSTARNKDQQRFARLIEHAGTAVAGLRAVDREAHRLFLPMLFGNIESWPREQREQTSQDLVSFAYDSEITPALRVSLAALDSLSVQEADVDVRRLSRDLIDVCRGGTERHDTEVRLLTTNVATETDRAVEDYLSFLLDALKEPERADSDELRSIARQFVGTLDTPAVSTLTLSALPSSYVVPDGSASGVDSDDDGFSFYGFGPSLTLPEKSRLITTVRPYADLAEGIFGQLLALQNRVFPHLPTPVWVWQAS